MKQSRNLTRHVKELEALYEQVLSESSEPKGFEQEKDVSDEIQPSNSGPEGIENDVEEPVEVDETVKEMAHEDDEDDDNENDSDEESSEDEKQNNENTGKTNISNINTSMSDKNIFDKLYSTIMEADDELGDSLDVGLGGEEEGFDDFGDEGGEEICAV